MRIYHSLWQPAGRLVFWAEDSSLYSQNCQSNSVADSVSDATVHPFACSTEQIIQDLNNLEFDADSIENTHIGLPTSNNIPLPSPRCFMGNDFDSEESASLTHWLIPSAVFEPFPSIAFLTSIPPTLPEGIIFSDSTLYWIEATKLLLDMLTRGRFVPGIHNNNNKLTAQWHLVPSESQDRPRIITMAEAMPTSCRNGGLQTPNGKPESLAILESFFQIASDNTVRSFLRRLNLQPTLSDNYTSSKFLAIHEWLRGLTSERCMLTASPSELADLHKSLRRWSGRMLTVTPNQKLDIYFALNTPNNSEDNCENDDDPMWELSFHIQEGEKSDSELSADQIWRGELAFLNRSEYTADDVEERFISGLAQAAIVCPPLRKALAQPHPTYASLTTSEAYTFLTSTALLLEENGFGVTLPHWWKKAEKQIGLHLTVKTPSSSSSSNPNCTVGLNQLLDYSWQIALGDKLIDIDEFKKIVSQQAPIVQIGQQWVELNPEKIASTLEYLERNAQKTKMTALEALRIGLGTQIDSGIFDVVGFSAEGWLNHFLETAHTPHDNFVQPEGFKGELRAYQLEGISWLSYLTNLGIGSCLADDMGLGKTIQLLALLLHERSLNTTPATPKPLPTLLVVPMSILDNWQREANRFAPQLTTYMHHGAQRLSGEEFRRITQSSDIVITTYALIFRDERIFSEIEWGRIALDEAQNIKNLHTKQTQAVRRIVHAQLNNPMRSTSCQRLALTGTPLENHLEELWSIMDFLNPGYLGSLSHFRKRFANPIERYKSKEASTALCKVIAPFILRRLKTDPEVISDLPEKIEIEVITTLSNEQASLYQQAIDRMLPQVDHAEGIHKKGLILSTITRLKQICNHPALALKQSEPIGNRSGKLDRLCEILEVLLAAGDKTLIFTQYAQMGHLLKRHLYETFGVDVIFLHGSLTKTARDKLVTRFQQADGPPIFVLSLKAGGYGLNLTQANQVIHYDQWWNPAVESQATDRAYRIGQTRNVQVRKFICRGTLEERIAVMLQHKKSLANEIVGSTRNTITQLSSNELRSLLQLTEYPTERSKE